MNSRQLAVLLLLIFVVCSGCSAKLPAARGVPPNSYTVNGQTYYPVKKVAPGYFEKGVASWYGPGYNGRLAASGEIYDMHAMTAAHRTLPMNTVVRVTNLENRRQAIVRINDRGPFVKDRVVDLSLSAARKLDLVKAGSASVRLDVLVDGASQEANNFKRLFEARSRLAAAGNPFFRGWPERAGTSR
jgi:rare lipoprotein A